VSVEVGGDFDPSVAKLSAGGPYLSLRSGSRIGIANACVRICAAEFVAVALAAYFGSILYHYAAGEPWPSSLSYASASICIATLVLVVSLGFHHFVELQRRPLHVLIWNGVGAAALAFSLFLSSLFLLKITQDYSRGAFVFQIITVCIAVCIARATSYLWIQSSVKSGLIEARRVILIGDEQHRSQLAKLLSNAGVRGIASAPFPFHHGAADAARRDCGRVHGEEVRDLIKFCRSKSPDDILILAAQEDFGASPELAGRLSELPANIHIVPVGSINIFSISRIVELGNVKTLQVSSLPLSLFDRCLKRAFDIVVATAALLVLFPLLTIVAIAIKMNSAGSVLFRQERHGYNNKTIRILKFRTMAEEEDDGSKRFVQATRQDRRVTLLGRVLRRTNIDELPQLFNVLFGDMSIVGPRPHAIDHSEMFEDQISPYYRRHTMKPGITGWAQVNGCRGETDTLEKMERRIEHDLYYIDNWSLLFDVKIVLLTLFSKKAYLNAY
jgi:Undecaprenyl-phosphate glucose phosphotransferase